MPQTERNKAILMRSFDEAWNNPREGVLEDLMHPNIRGYGMLKPDGTEVDTLEDYKQFYSAMRKAFPDFQVEVHEVLAEEDLVSARCTCRATHLGDGLGFPATGRSVEFEGMGIVRIAEGKIVEAWNNFDFLGLYQQLGLMNPVA